MLGKRNFHTNKIEKKEELISLLKGYYWYKHLINQITLLNNTHNKTLYLYLHVIVVVVVCWLFYNSKDYVFILVLKTNLNQIINSY